MLLTTILTQMFPPKPTWSVNHIPNLSGKVALVTGANTGIGKETCKHLLRKGATVYLAARSQTKAEAAIRELYEETGKLADFLQLDLADLDSVKKAAEEFLSRRYQLDILYLNAGVANSPIEELTAQGFDLTFGTNVLGHFLLLKLLYPVLRMSSTLDSDSRVIWTASLAHFFWSPPIQYDSLTDTPKRRKLGAGRMYCESKFATVMLVNHLAKWSAADGIVAIAVDPGNIRSDLQRHDEGFWLKLLQRIILFPIEYGAIDQLWAGTTAEAAHYNGRYVRPWARLGEPQAGTMDAAEQEKLWNYCEGRVGSWL